MSMVFFERIIATLGRRLNYDAIVNYAGNSNISKPWDAINDSNPLTMAHKSTNTADKSGLGKMLGLMGL